MYLSKENRIVIKNKFGEKCAYSGTVLDYDWKISHLKPLNNENHKGNPVFEEFKDLDNIVPSQRLINRYKGNCSLEDFKVRLAKLNGKLAKLPLHPRTPKNIQKKKDLKKLANYFGITKKKPFSGMFYFEMLNN